MVLKSRWLTLLLIGYMWTLSSAAARPPRLAASGHPAKSVALSKKIRATSKKASPRMTSSHSQYGGQSRSAFPAMDAEDDEAFDRLSASDDVDASAWESSHSDISESLQASAPEVETRAVARPKAPPPSAREDEEDEDGEDESGAESLPHYEANTFPLSNLMRPLILPRGLYEIRSPVLMESYSSIEQTYGVLLQGTAGVTRWLEVGVAAPLFFVPQLVIGDFQAHATADLTDWLDSPHWVGVGFDLILPWSSQTSWELGVKAVALGSAQWKAPLAGHWLAGRARLSAGGALGADPFPLFFLDPSLVLEPFTRVSLELGVGMHVHVEKPVTALMIPATAKFLCAVASAVDITLEASYVDVSHPKEFHIGLGTQVRF